MAERPKGVYRVAIEDIVYGGCHVQLEKFGSTGFQDVPSGYVLARNRRAARRVAKKMLKKQGQPLRTRREYIE